jgi:hypothetical protein
MPDFKQRISELEQKLADLKAQHAAGQISTVAYVDQAGRLRFTDDADGRTWWLDPNSGLWYAEAASAPRFDLAMAELSKRAASPPPSPPEEPVASPPPPAWGESLPPTKPIEKLSATPPSRVLSFFSGRRLKFIIPLEIVACCLAAFAGLYLLSPESFQPISARVAPSAQPPLGSARPPLAAAPLPTLTPTPTTAPTATPEPTTTSTPVPSPSAQPPLGTPTLTPVPPSDTPTPTPTLSPTRAAARAAATPSPTPPAPFSGKLAYPFYVDAAHNFAIEVMDLASRQVIFTRQQASQPALTSDGTHLAYRSWDSSHLGLFEVMLTGQNERYLSVHEESQRPQWGPDNRAVAFSFLKTEGDREIKTIDFDDENFPLVPPDPGGFAQTAAWTPDGRLVFHACRMNACGLASALPNGADFAFLTDSPDDISPAVSPDGQQIAYTSRQGDNWDVYRVGIKGGEPTRLTTQPGKDGIPVWSPDGAWIAYASEVDGRWAIWVMTPDGQDQQQLVPLPGSLEGKVEAFVDDVQRGWRMESISWVR